MIMMRSTYHKKGAQREAASLFEMMNHRQLTPDERKKIRIVYERPPEGTQEIERLEIEEDGNLTFYTSKIS